MNNNETPEARVRQQTSHAEISRRAEELWRQYGCPQGRDEEIWLEAERQLRGTASTLASPAAEGVGPAPSGEENPVRVAQEKIRSRETEMMEPKKAPGPKAGRGKNKQSGK